MRLRIVVVLFLTTLMVTSSIAALAEKPETPSASGTGWDNMSENAKTALGNHAGFVGVESDGGGDLSEGDGEDSDIDDSDGDTTTVGVFDI